jgi:heme-degrading monooxygenase HmoA
MRCPQVDPRVLRPGVMRERLDTAGSADGWLSAHILRPLYSPRQRVIVGVWESQAAREAWHNDPAFLRTRDRLVDLGSGVGEMAGHEAVYDTRR